MWLNVLHAENCASQWEEGQSLKQKDNKRRENKGKKGKASQNKISKFDFLAYPSINVVKQNARGKKTCCHVANACWVDWS